MSDVPGSPKVTRCTSKPAPLRIFSSTPSAPASAGVTEGQRTRSRAMVRASVIRVAQPVEFSSKLVPQQFVDAGLGAGALVDALDDDGAGGRGTGLAVLEGARGQCPRHHHGIFRNFADKRLPGVAID